uniref:Bifunctional inhibitor/plant lipid transfer protein/seed storage helical domain-containing protein n=1 Tax=Tanacetum cinerariifolium TaxID=118510 RepID=A0A699QMP4_TANCI|nr:hypothetical protein [Tanacetum cinerariifolium]
MMRSSKKCCVFVLSVLLVTCMSQVPCIDALNCNYTELLACTDTITSHKPPSSVCCSKDAQRVAGQCGVTLPKC